MDMNTTKDIYDSDSLLQDALRLIDGSSKSANTTKPHPWLPHAPGGEEGQRREACEVRVRLKVMVENVGVPVETARRKDVEDLFVLIQKRVYAPGERCTPHTISDYFASKYFSEFVHSGNMGRETPYPKEVRWSTIVRTPTGNAKVA